MSDSQDRKTYSQGLERVLLQAARDPAFHGDLKQRRAVAAAEQGIELTPHERAMLEAIGPQQLDDAVGGLRGRAAAEPSFAGRVEMPAGIRPDVIRGSRQLFTGIRPDTPPDSPPGCSRRSIAVAAAGGIAAVAAAGVCGYSVTLGHTAELPPERLDVMADAGAPDAGAPDARPQQRDAVTDDAGEP